MSTVKKWKQPRNIAVSDLVLMAMGGWRVPIRGVFQYLEINRNVGDTKWC